ncbi:MAG: helix-turn-helix domain-containing protein [Phycisphaerae bacterium]|nr:helix-turn-helix domain-containing protein [Phycisphaerae bacterium]
MHRSSRSSGRVGVHPEVMTISDLAVYLQVSTSSLYKLAQRGKVPGRKVGKHWRFRKVDVDRWLSRKKGN